MKQNNLIYWISTGLIFLMEGVMPALTGHTEMAIEGIRHLGFPDYFRIELNILKVIGALVLILPMVPVRVKEWAYAGFGIVLISATVGHSVVDGVNFQSFMPLIFLGILVVSNVTLHRKLGIKN
jgi:DoxX-like family